jgi:hypothetical protein
MYLKIHETKEGRIIAACDKDLIGKVLDDGKGFIDLDTYQGFYVGELSDKKSLSKALARFHSINLVGKKSIAVALRLGLIKPEDVMHINNVPYIQIYKI